MMKRKRGRRPLRRSKARIGSPMPPPCRRRPNDFGSEQLAIEKLDDAAGVRADPLQDRDASARRPELIKRSDRVAVVFSPTELRDPWEERPNIYLNGEPRSAGCSCGITTELNILGISVEAGAGAAGQNAKNRCGSRASCGARLAGNHAFRCSGVPGFPEIKSSRHRPQVAGSP